MRFSQGSCGALQVETRSCFESLDDVLSVPGITCAFLGEAKSLQGRGAGEGRRHILKAGSADRL